MTWHPTTNRIQTMILTPEERATLETWPHGLSMWTQTGWYDFKNTEKTQLVDGIIYRGKPAPVVTSVWLNVYVSHSSNPYRSRENADAHAFKSRVDVLRIDTCNGVSTAHLEGLKDE
jgi:hypothetical protein